MATNPTNQPNNEPSIDELRRGEWGISPQIFAQGAELPRRTDGTDYTHDEDAQA